MNRKDTLKIGNAGGYWGDDPQALLRQVEGGHLDYITMDFLAEVTMSIMQKQRARDSSLGYAKDFLVMLRDVLPQLLDQGTCLITNAGGVHPEACAAAIEELGKELGLKPKISVVYGDDILDRLAELQAKGCQFANMETGAKFDQIADQVEAANIYFGAAPVVEALKDGPDIIITGRVTDTGITVAPMIYEFGWSFKDYDKIAAGIIAGHILECGCQATGGNFSDWRLVPSFKNMGFPIAEVEPSGKFTITKHPGTGGLVSADTIREQLFYEMGRPDAYLTPDVVADFTTIQLHDKGNHQVEVKGIKGYEPTALYKVSMAFSDGFKCIGEIAVSGPEAKAKAESLARVVWDKAGTDFEERSTEYFGWNALHRSIAGHTDGNEIIIRLGVRDYDREKLRTFSKIIPSVILAGPPGVCILGGVPRIAEVVSYWPALMSKSAIEPKVATYSGSLTNIRGGPGTIVGDFAAPGSSPAIAKTATTSVEQSIDPEPSNESERILALSQLCLTRSGDKGDSVNIGVMARSSAAYEFLGQWLTAQRVKNLFQEFCSGAVERYELPNLQGYNFLLGNALGGGGTLTLRTDAQGKMFAQALGRVTVAVPPSWCARIETEDKSVLLGQPHSSSQGTTASSGSFSKGKR